MMIAPVNQDNSPKANLRSLQVLCMALIGGATVFSVIVIVLNQVSGPAMKPVDLQFKNIMIVVVAVLAIVCLTRAIMTYKKGITAIKNSTVSLNEKLNQYRTVLILYMAFCEGPALFSIIVFFLTGEYLVFGVTLIMLAAMFVRVPKKNKIADELSLGFQEQHELE